MQMADKLRIPRWLDHAVREAVQDERGPLFIAAPYATRLDEVATKTLYAAPDDIARLGFAIAHAIDADAPAVPDFPDHLASLAGTIANAVAGSSNGPLLFRVSAAEASQCLRRPPQVAWALVQTGTPAGLSFAFRSQTRFGPGLMGGGTLSDAFTGQEGAVRYSDRSRKRSFPACARASKFDEFLNSVPHVVALDSLLNPTSADAEVVLPAATFAESEGTFVNTKAERSAFQDFRSERGALKRVGDGCARLGRFGMQAIW